MSRKLRFFRELIVLLNAINYKNSQAPLVMGA